MRTNMRKALIRRLIARIDAETDERQIAQLMQVLKAHQRKLERDQKLSLDDPPGSLPDQK